MIYTSKTEGDEGIRPAQVRRATARLRSGELGVKVMSLAAAAGSATANLTLARALDASVDSFTHGPGVDLAAWGAALRVHSTLGPAFVAAAIATELLKWTPVPLVRGAIATLQRVIHSADESEWRPALERERQTLDAEIDRTRRDLERLNTLELVVDELEDERARTYTDEVWPVDEVHEDAYDVERERLAARVRGGQLALAVLDSVAAEDALAALSSLQFQVEWLLEAKGLDGAIDPVFDDARARAQASIREWAFSR